MSILQFAPFQSQVDEGFWHRLSSLKLNKLGIDDSPIPITGFFAPCSHHQVSNHLTLLAESLPPESSEQPFNPVISSGNRNRCPVPGVIYNTNTLESFNALDKQSLIKAEAKKIWEDIHSGKVEEDCSVLLRFLVISFADLKQWSFRYWFAFPALILDPPATVIDLKPASKYFSLEEAEALKVACNDWRNTGSTTDIPFFLVSVSSNSVVTIRPLSDFEACQRDGHKVLFGFYDPCHLPNNPGWPLRNFLLYIFTRWGCQNAKFLCYRESRGFADLESSLVGEASVSNSQALSNTQNLPNAVGWELNNRGQKLPRRISLAQTMDPTRLATAAADLNLKLMRWRALPSLDLNVLSSTKCLILGVGALGCQVARMLMAWGVRKITLVDSGKVSMSNPLRQSLYTFDDCLNGGEFKATAAVKSLSRIFPAVEAEAVIMAIPMPGHPVTSQEENKVLQDCKRLHELIDSHDAIFLLTDTRESRWLPSLLCANANKITITAALGFDSFLVMRHGAGPVDPTCVVKSVNLNDLSADIGTVRLTEDSGRQRLGCYFCSDVVAPINSTSNCTLDQHCTVTRPGLAPIASSLAVELLVGILHHPSGHFAKAEFANSTDTSSNEQPLGILPHQIRGSLSQCSQMTLVGHASTSCTACSSFVVSEYGKRGLDFLLEAINHPTYLEDITGLMRCRALPSLDLKVLSSTKCLLLGAGTLGCQVARMLMVWGARKITLVDSGKVSMSNPLRQSLYTLEDCLNGGEFKATAAVKSLSRICPAVEAEAVIMAIPMPGHPVTSQEENKVLQDCKRLDELIDSHDAIFLLTDTRESRWLPSLLCANANKITITAALGFDSFLVMRHGAGPVDPTCVVKSVNVNDLSADNGIIRLTEDSRRQRLGCYFCNDVVAPIDSTSNRTLDQQCTVTRPGLALIASSLAVEVLVGILQHPSGLFAKAEFANSTDTSSNKQPLGILPHQIRGSLSQCSQMTLVGHASTSCTACSSTVVSEYEKRGLDFLLEAINHPTYLEDITGLTELMKSAGSFNLDWDDETSDEDEEFAEI